jgi:Uma2 family endonuclease
VANATNALPGSYTVAMVTKTRMPVEDYLALVEDEGPYFEYIDGEAVQKPMPDWRHLVLDDEFAGALRDHRKRHGGVSGPEGRVCFDDQASFSGRQYRLPDLAYWAPGKPFRGQEAMQPPTLTVEIGSPDQTRRELRERCRYFREHGVDAVWMVDPNSRTVEVFDADRDGVVLQEGDMLSSAAAPGLEIDLAAMFKAMDEAGTQ